MDEKQLNIANIKNLTLLWKLMGVRISPVNGMGKFLLSDHWPHRCWPEEKLKADALVAIGQNIRQLNNSCVVPVFHFAGANTRYLENILTSNDFKIAFEQTAMYLEMNTYTPASQSQLELITVSHAHDIEQWTEVASISFNYKIDTAAIHAIACHPDVKLISACVDHRPVATAMLFNTGNITGLHQVGVLPSDRGQGIAYHLMNDILLLCRQMGAGYITLQASTAAEGLYEKLGFIRQYKISNYQRTA